MRIDDPWSDALAAGSCEHDALPAVIGGRDRSVRPVRSVRPGPPDRSGRAVLRAYDAQAAVYLTVQRSAAFQQVRRRYRRFVLPASAAFLTWYLAYLVTATVLPDLMARPVLGVFNVAMAAGLAQFASTFVLTWAYLRHARLRRDQLAFELRWETQDMARTHAAARAVPESAR